MIVELSDQLIVENFALKSGFLTVNSRKIVFSRGLATLELAVSVGRSVGRSVRRSVGNQNKMRAFFCYSAPAHPSAT